ncbi:hypothetical protein CO009_02285 [Candidatus Shapirobacteria bacterium CG_4_8_14_3_um_filter_35_11]|uniref:Phosphodiester glycosidase domain-containing protein n=1 Tax=Candidatus Shapirobacteria bacterium CG_4_8_14_3_um_filter_35_11 TaxID=1974874 RepID=A0A2M8GJY3_9BACT|nr:MAG: hypothetical protein CO009_02285 [Candidatus Shapirobacteria bacterium CG_4_8_14_3_um_filter_35_11]
MAFLLSLFFPSIPTPAITTPSPKPYYYYYQVNKLNKFIVVPNFNNPKDSVDLIKENNCKYAINGGLYQENNKPLGLFINDHKTINKKINSNIFNGYLFLNNNILNIGQTINNISQFIMQTGPFFDLKSTSINYNNKTARRHVIAKDSANNLYIFSIFTPDSFISGPTLNQIPKFFQKPEIKKIADFTQILTLDGGSASVFYSPTDSLHESTFIGSLLCWR